MKITLTKPVTAHGEEIGEFEMREPTGKDVRELGYPYLVLVGDQGASGIELRPGVAMKYASRLAGIPPSSLDQMCPADISAITGVVMGFFGVEGEA